MELIDRMKAGIACWTCGKDLRPPEGVNSLKGKTIRVRHEIETTVKEIEYLNHQLGKYSDGHDGCDVAICYECFIDKEFGIEPFPSL